MLANQSSNQNSGDLINHVDLVLFIIYPSFRLQEWDYFLPYGKIFLLPFPVIFFFSVLSKKEELLQGEKNVELTQMVDYLCISSSISFHASLTSQHYNLFELPPVISTPSLLTIAH